MKALLRKLRGLLGTAATWAAGWGILFGGLVVGFGSPLGEVLEAVVGGGFLGACAGASFGVILSIAERRRTLQQLSLRRIATWGALGGMALFLAVSPMAMVQMLRAGIPLSAMLSFLTPLAISGLLGTTFATGSVLLARRAERKLEISGEEWEALSSGDWNPRSQ